MNDSRETLGDIVARLSGAEAGAISKELVKEWLNHDDPEVRGAAYTLLREKDRRLLTDPPLTSDETADLVVTFFERTVSLRKAGDWSFSGYEAAWDFASWFAFVAESGIASSSTLESIAGCLARLYLASDEEARTTIEHGALEHIMERKSLRKLFRKWPKKPGLAEAYFTASSWSEHGGTHRLWGGIRLLQKRRRSGEVPVPE